MSRFVNKMGHNIIWFVELNKKAENNRRVKWVFNQNPWHNDKNANEKEEQNQKNQQRMSYQEIFIVIIIDNDFYEKYIPNVMLMTLLYHHSRISS